MLRSELVPTSTRSRSHNKSRQQMNGRNGWDRPHQRGRAGEIKSWRGEDDVGDGVAEVVNVNVRRMRSGEGWDSVGRRQAAQKKGGTR